MQNQVLHLILRKPVNARRKLCKNQKINGKELKIPEEMTYRMAWNFPLIKTILIQEKKRKAEEENTEDSFCKSLATDLKEIPLYERVNAKKRNKRDCFQMSLLTRELSSSLQTGKLSQTMQGNSVPLGCSSIYYLSALSDTTIYTNPKTMERKWN